MSMNHPALTPERIQELSELARRIDREEAEDIKALGRKVLAWRDAGRLKPLTPAELAKEFEARDAYRNHRP